MPLESAQHCPHDARNVLGVSGRRTQKNQLTAEKSEDVFPQTRGVLLVLQTEPLAHSNPSKTERKISQKTQKGLALINYLLSASPGVFSHSKHGINYLLQAGIVKKKKKKR